MDKTMLRVAKRCAREVMGLHLRDLRGLTMREVFDQIDSPMVPVYWGSWTDADLAVRIGKETDR